MIASALILLAIAVNALDTYIVNEAPGGSISCGGVKVTAKDVGTGQFVDPDELFADGIAAKIGYTPCKAPTIWPGGLEQQSLLRTSVERPSKNKVKQALVVAVAVQVPPIEPITNVHACWQGHAWYLAEDKDWTKCEG
ncbi:hypothetical protein PYCC9005_000965 [Savitreella phatthalungensis]